MVEANCRIVFESGVTRAQAEVVVQALESFCKVYAVKDFRAFISEEESFRLIRLPRFATLTMRERQILKMLAEGNKVREIAADLILSVKTVEAHKFNLMRKLDIHNKADLIGYAIQKEIIHIPARA